MTGKWLLLITAILLEVTATLSLRGALDHPALYVVAVGSIVALSRVLRAGMALGVAYGIWAPAGVALTSIASRVLFGEPLTKVMGAGICLIIVGVLCIELGAAH
ncbi:multidrug efflux SMR transporter [Streptomyces sp. PSKA30]|uniref:DMT family transporter n=1 Tax=Streptomyces sp. PSKA30 TaxID=2874597 RepID=UPI0021E2173C|nr:SMR family transporter [Streptomyces sp. PSKA30]